MQIPLPQGCHSNSKIEMEDIWRTFGGHLEDINRGYFFLYLFEFLFNQFYAPKIELADVIGVYALLLKAFLIMTIYMYCETYSPSVLYDY